MLKWPRRVTFIRHAPSVYNEQRAKRRQDPEYRAFVELYHQDPASVRCQSTANRLMPKWCQQTGDHQTPLSDMSRHVAVKTGRNLSQQRNNKLPDVVFVSTFLRTQQTLEAMIEGWPELGTVEKVTDERLREQEHGLVAVYGSREIMLTLEPLQRSLFALTGAYNFRYPQGESVADVNRRTHSFSEMLIREYADCDVLVVAHHLTILSFRANLERWSPDEFIRVDEEEKPINCGVTVYEGVPDIGRRGEGKLNLVQYNQRLY